MSGSFEQGERLLAHLLAKDGDPSLPSNDLLGALHRGFPVDRIRVLLEHQDPDLVGIGAWLLSELGSRGRPLARILPTLLKHERKDVRFFAVDSVMSCATRDDGSLVGAALKLIDDPEAAVRWKVNALLWRMPTDVLLSATPFVPEEIKEGLACLVAEDDGTQARALLASTSAVRRRFGAAIATRHDLADVLTLATSSTDDEIRGIAREALARRQGT
jgi:hypothetical protein